MEALLRIYHDFYVFDFAKHFVFSVFIFVVIVDIAVGMMKAWATRTYDSTRARKGVVSHGVLALILLIIYPHLVHFGFGSISDIFLIYFVLAYMSSIAGNLIILGVPLPKQIVNWLEYEIHKYDKEIEERFGNRDTKEKKEKEQ